MALVLAACGGGNSEEIVTAGIATQPASVTVKAGDSATFRVAATGTGPFSYQWRKNGTAIAGATSDSYRIAAATAADTGAQFSVVVGNAAGSITSAAATLTVDTRVAPGIATPPATQTVSVGSTATFSVVATGSDPLQYQWKRNTVDIPGATAASYTTPPTTAADDGATFAVVVSNPAGTAPSDAVRLTVTPAPVPARITTPPASIAVTAGQTAAFTVAADGTAPLTYQWRRNGVDIVGATAASYTTAATSVAADNGARFGVVVNNVANVPVTSADAVLTVGAAPVAVSITTQPANAIVTAGQAASFSVVAAGTAPQYQWQRDGVPIAGATSPTYTLTTTTTADSGARFSVIVSNSVNSVPSNAATLTVNGIEIAPTIATQPADANVTAPGTATFNVAVNGTAPFSYQWRKNGAAIVGATAATYTTPATSVAADSGAVFNVVVTNAAGSVQSRDALLTVSAAPVPPSITTQPANATATVGHTATFNVGAAGTGPLTYQWRKNGVAITGATAASYTTPVLSNADNGALYSAVVNNAVGPAVTSGAAQLTVAALVPPSINSQPASATVLNGAAVSFSVTATGSAPLVYQWRKNGTDITGANSATYTIPQVTFFEDGATYTVVVSNASPTRATSNGATLTVTLPPSTVSQLATGNYHSLALRSDGTVFSWASWDRFNSVLANLDGVGNTASSPGAAVRAKNVDGTPVLDAVAVSAGEAHSVIVRRDKTVWAWGQSSSVQQACPIGDGVCVDRGFPTQVKDANGVPLTDVVQVNAGNYSTLVVKADGSVWAWGRNDVGQLGNGSVTLATNPVPVRAAAGGNLSGVTAVALGDTHALALKSDGTVLAWGRNTYGQLGNGTPSSSSALPVIVEIAPGIALSNVIAVAAGDEHSLALRSDNTVWSWGYNREGALGDGTTVSRSRAVQVRDMSGTPLAGITAIAAGNEHSLFLKSDGTVMATGANNLGQLGDNTTAANQTNAVFVRDAANNVFGGVVQIESTADHALVRRNDGSVWAWGRNDYRQLGDTTNVTRRNPVAVPAGS